MDYKKLTLEEMIDKVDEQQVFGLKTVSPEDGIKELKNYRLFAVQDEETFHGVEMDAFVTALCGGKLAAYMLERMTKYDTILSLKNYVGYVTPIEEKSEETKDEEEGFPDKEE